MTPALAKITPDQAKQLDGPVLTPFGAEKAGNADGSIPAYTGGLTGTPVPANTNTGMMPDPYASDKVLYTIDSKNLDQYKAQLTAGTIAMIQKDPGYRVEVYPTHRSAFYPKWVLDNIRKNATTAELLNAQGDGVKGVYGGIPFPIPQSGLELLWNTVLKWQGSYYNIHNAAGIFVDASGHKTLTQSTDVEAAFFLYDKTKTSLASDRILQTSVNRTHAPASQDGGIVLINYPIDYGNYDQAIYTYTIGQRRIRLAPEFKYDTPVAAAAGAFLYDEIGMWAGRPDKFDFKIAGKKEMLVPYNEYKAQQPNVTEDEVFQPRHVNPDFIRWEKHRVWVLEATLKPGKRHVYSRRTFYVDEDSWNILASDAYDQAGRMYRIGLDMGFSIYNTTEPFIYPVTFIDYNLEQNTYNWQGFYGIPYVGQMSSSEAIPSLSRFTPENVAGTGIR